MNTETLFPDAPPIVVEGDRRYVPIPWEGADALREALLKHGCPATLCLDPETRHARLELWPGVTAEAIRAVLDARRPERRETTGTAVPGAARGSNVTPEVTELICI